ncbi:hypothetical protein [Alicyclobacillus fodiniaquatilis]|uniref:Uncharacterized protein n=1 Tax=Alicyclobacillus fodiniaquatilis TaxID=1661150 RepID=A0ABW4JHJ2_9BACL
MAGDFLDLLVAITCLVCILRAHKVIRHFLDLLIPGGPGPGGLGHAMMEGLGFGAASSMVKGGLNAGKAAVGLGAGLAASAGMGGLAAVAKNRAAKAAMPSLGSNISNAVNGMANGNSSPNSLYPAGLPGNTNQPAGFLGDGQAKTSTGYGEGEGFTFNDPNVSRQSQPFNFSDAEDNSTQNSNPSFSNSKNSTFGNLGSNSNTAQGSPGSQTSHGPKRNNTYDQSSRKGGAYTRVNPSAQSRLAREVQEGFGVDEEKSDRQAFSEGAKERFNNDLKHRFLDGNKGYSRGRSLMGVAFRDLNDANEGKESAMNSNQFLSNSLIPRDDMLTDYNSGDPIAAESLMEIGAEQMAMQEAYGWIDQADQMETAIQPAYEDSERDYNYAEAEYRQHSNLVLEMRARGMTDSPDYQQAVAELGAMELRRDSAQNTFKMRREQLDNVQDLRSRGTTRVTQARERIYSLNSSYNPANQRQRNIEAAMRTAGRRTFSDLY